MVLAVYGSREYRVYVRRRAPNVMDLLTVTELPAKATGYDC